MFEKKSSVDNSKKKKNESENKREKEIIFPHGESILRLFKDKYKDDLEKAEIVEDILYEFFEQEMENIEIFKSEKLGAAFPWTVIKTKELLQKIIEKYSNQDELKKQLNDLAKDDTIRKQEFIFSSGSIMKSGYPFTFVEEAMHQAVISLKSDLASLQAGEKVVGREIYTIGLPTNELGKVTPDFLEKIKKNPFDALGELQTEFIESHISKHEDGVQKLSINLYGISTGASLAASTGEKLIARGIASQDLKNKEPNMPRLFVRMDSPVGLSKLTRKNWQIPLGYISEFIYQTFKDPKFRLADPKFMSQVKKALSERGILENMTSQDKQMKTEAIKVMLDKLKKGVEFDEKLKVTKVTGLLDPLTFSPEEYQTEKARRKNFAGSPAAYIAPRTEENRREFMINQTHTPAFFRDSELGQYYRVADLIEKLKK